MDFWVLISIELVVDVADGDWAHDYVPHQHHVDDEVEQPDKEALDFELRQEAYIHIECEQQTENEAHQVKPIEYAQSSLLVYW